MITSKPLPDSEDNYNTITRRVRVMRWHNVHTVFVNVESLQLLNLPLACRGSLTSHGRRSVFLSIQDLSVIAWPWFYAWVTEADQSELAKCRVSHGHNDMTRSQRYMIEVVNLEWKAFADSQWVCNEKMNTCATIAA